MKKIINSILVIVLVGSLFSCSKSSLDPTLAQNKAVETSITSLEDIQGLLYGAYDRMTNSAYYGRDFIIFGEVRSDNCFSNGNSGRFVTPAAMKMGDDDGYALNTWAQIYRVIANANIIIGQDPSKLTGDKDVINNVIGQAYAVRALAHFDLLKLYGEQHVTGGNNLGIPYVMQYKGDDLLPARNTVAEDKSFIEADLAKALTLMSPALNAADKESISTYAVYALQSRVAIYFGDWAAAKTACEKVINSGVYTIAAPSDYSKTFSAKGTDNVIFELAERPTDNQNINGLSYIYRGNSYGDIQALPDLLSIFDDGDVRAAADMIAFDADGKLRNIGKYPTNANYDYDIPLIRYEEVILNYAEALFHLGDANALTYLNMITSKRLANAYTTINEENILQERRRELCFEGFRFDDLARTHNDIPLVAPLLQTHGGPAYGSYNFAFPIPIAEINANSNMVQNKGY